MIKQSNLTSTCYRIKYYPPVNTQLENNVNEGVLNIPQNSSKVPSVSGTGLYLVYDMHKLGCVSVV